MTMTRQIKGAVTGALNKQFGADELRHIVLGRLFSDTPMVAISSKTLSDGQWFALYSWISFYEADGQWIWSESFHKEGLEVLTEALRSLSGIGGMVETAVQIGGEITDVRENEPSTTTQTPELPVPASLLSKTKFYQNKLAKEREKKILSELGFDD